MVLAALCCVVLLLSFANGANDNLKGVATLLGSGTANYRRALSWGTGCTALGSLTAAWLAAELLKAFSGKGLVADTLVQQSQFAAAVAGGAALTVLLATRFGIPVSTTHGLLGGLVGAGVAAGSAIDPGQLLSAFIVPLLLSPLLAIVAAVIVYPVLSWLRARMGVVVESGAGEALALEHDEPAATASVYSGRIMGVPAQRLLDLLHFGSAGIVSFARGLNDTPKIAALMLLGFTGSGVWPILLVGLAMAAGGILRGRRVAETMSRRITEMNHGQGFTANVLGGSIVIGASWLGLPVSTTHVMCGALFGIGTVNGRAHWKTISGIAAAWLVTLPCGMVLGGACYLGLSWLA